MIEYDFETPQKVLEGIRAVDEKHRSIRKGSVKVLRYVRVEGNPYRFWKRLIDVVISVCALLLGVIPSALICLLIYVDDPGPAFFSQYRVGRNGKRFIRFKFRTVETENYCPCLAA